MTASEAAMGDFDGDTEFAELEAEEPPRLDDIYGVLQNKRRRLILRYLAEEKLTTDIGTLAEHVAADENDITRAELQSKQRKRVYISLYQSHLPKLDSAGAIRYDKARGTVERGADFAEFRNVLLREKAIDQDSKNVKAGSSMIASVVLAGVLVFGSSSPVLSPVPVRFLSVFVIIVLLFLAATAVFGGSSDTDLLGRFPR